MSKNTGKLIASVFVGATVLGLGGVAAYLYSDGYFGNSDTPLESARIIPNNAVMAGVISTNPQAWSQLQQFGTPEAQKVVDKSIQDFQKDAFTDSKVNFEKDIKPWLGSVMFAVLPSSASKPAQKTDLLVVVGIKNKFSMLNFGNKFRSDKKQGEIKEVDYKGIKILESTDKGKKSYAAILKNHLVLADEIKTVQLAIDAFKGSPSLASKADAASMLSNDVGVQNPIAQFYLPDYEALVQEISAQGGSTAPLNPETLKQLKQVKSVVAAVGIDNAGVRMKAIAKLNPSALKIEYKPSPGKVVAQFPAETFALANGQGISRYWSAIVEKSKSEPQMQQAIDGARQQVKTLNFDLDKEIFGWMDGEFALAAIPSNQGILSNVGFGGALVLETSDRTTAEATLNKLDEIAKSYSITIAPRNIEGKTVTEWQVPQQGALLGHGWLDGNSLFVAFGGPISDAIATKPSQPLDSSESFKAITGSLPKPNGGYFYLDMDKTMSLVNSTLPPAQKSFISPEASAVLNSIRGLAFTAAQPDSSTSQIEMLLALKPKVK